MFKLKFTMAAFAVLINAVFGGAIAFAQNNDDFISTVGTDTFAFAESVRTDAADATDGNILAMAGEIRIENPVGSAFLFGQDIEISGGASGTVVAVGQNLVSAGDIHGSAYMAGESLSLSHTQSGGTLFAAGTDIKLDVVATNDIFVAGEFVHLSGSYQGDVIVSSQSLEVAEGTQIAGELRHETTDAVIPATLNARKITAAEAAAAFGMQHWESTESPSFVDRLIGNLIGLVIMLIVGALLFLIFRNQAPRTSQWLRTAPIKSLVLSFVGLAALIGAPWALGLEILVASAGLTWFLAVLLILVPVVMLICGVVGLYAYFIGVHAVVDLFEGPIERLGLETDTWVGQSAVLAIGLVLLTLVGVIWAGLATVLSLCAIMLGLGLLLMRTIIGRADTI